MSDVQSEFIVDCQDVACSGHSAITCSGHSDITCSGHSAITVILNFHQLPMSQNIVSQILNFKFEDAGLSRRLNQKLDSMLDATPSGLLQVNRCTISNRLFDLLSFNMIC